MCINFYYLLQSFKGIIIIFTVENNARYVTQLVYFLEREAS